MSGKLISGFNRAGWPYLTVTVLLAAVATALDVWWLAIPLWLFAVECLIFFRDPRRSCVAGPEMVISPADGRIVALELVDQPQMPQGKAMLVSIFMNIFDVHVNRVPLDGRVERVVYRRGGFRPADQPGARTDNEQVGVLIQNQRGPLYVTQVAGLVARRIECWVQPGDDVTRGDRYGLIRFGSRLDVYLPPESRVMVALGQKVRAGQSILGEMP